MKRAWPVWAKILTGLFVTAMYAMPQAYTISAKPGVVNYIEGNAFVNGQPVSAQNLKATFLNANDTISTDIGKAEVLLSPGVFLRVGENTQVRMVSPSLTDTQIEVKAGQAMIEADDIVKDSRITVLNSGSTTIIEKNGLYRFTGGDAPAVAVLEGKAQVLGPDDKKTDVGKGRQVLLSEGMKAQKFDTKREDDLYAWSNVRSQYNAASSYQAAKDVNSANYGGVWGDYGFGGWSRPGWFWNSGFNSWSWLPGNSAFYSPFGYGFYGPGLVGYAPLIYAPLYGGYGGGRYRYGGRPGSSNLAGGGKPAAVPVNPGRPPAMGITASPHANDAARTQAMRSFSGTGFNTGSGMMMPAGRGMAMPAGRATGVYAGPRMGPGGPSAAGRSASPAGGFGGGRPGGAGTTPGASRGMSAPAGGGARGGPSPR